MTPELAQNICEFLLSTNGPRWRRPLTRGLLPTPPDLCKSEAELTAGWRREDFDPRNWPKPRLVEVAPGVHTAMSDSKVLRSFTINTEQVV